MFTSYRKSMGNSIDTNSTRKSTGIINIKSKSVADPGFRKNCMSKRKKRDPGGPLVPTNASCYTLNLIFKITKVLLEISQNRMSCYPSILLFYSSVLLLVFNSQCSISIVLLLLLSVHTHHSLNPYPTACNNCALDVIISVPLAQQQQGIPTTKRVGCLCTQLLCTPHHLSLSYMIYSRARLIRTANARKNRANYPSMRIIRAYFTLHFYQ